MTEYCVNHPDRMALSFCHSCKRYFCADCLEEGSEYYYCREKACIDACVSEMKEYEEVAASQDDEIPKIMIEGKATTFCEKCIEETTSEKIRVGYFAQGHSKLTNERDRCEKCGSVVMDLKLRVFPLLPFQSTQGTYRVIKSEEFDPGYLYLKKDSFISRKRRE